MKYLILLTGLLLAGCDNGPGAENAKKEYRPCPLEERGDLPSSQDIKFVGTQKDTISYCVTVLLSKGHPIKTNTYEVAYMIEIYNKGSYSEPVKVDVMFPDFATIAVQEESVPSRQIIGGIRYNLEVPPSRSMGTLIYLSAHIRFLTDRSNHNTVMFFRSTGK